jgi:hypothetical protein
MVSLSTIMWLLPAVFMVHELEEIIMMRPWYVKNEQFIRSHFPRLAPQIARTGSLSASAIALVAGEELVILTAVTLVSVEYGLYSVWAGFLIAFLLHLVFHVGSFFIMGRYVPYVITSALAAVYSGWALIVLYGAGVLRLTDVVLWTLFAIVFIVVNLDLAVRLAGRFDKWLEKWSSP